jgi:four helix bundle protein
MSNRNFMDLIVWRKAMDLVVAVYKSTAEFPREEMYGLTAQMRKAVVSVPSNIAEGEGRRTTGEFLNCLSVSYGSLRELETQVLISERLGYLPSEARERLIQQSSEIGRLLNGLRNSIEKER